MRHHLIIALAVFAAQPAWAQYKGDPSQRLPGNEAFRLLDKNGDGFLSRKEAEAEPELGRNFAAADANRDGKLSEDEYIKAMQARDKQYVDDATITTRIKAALLKEKGMPSTQISVETHKGRVQLSGFVDSAGVVSRAGRIAAGTPGVRSVQNSLAVK
ncbi:MAG: BON domain-containing protein [Betaproteobacteria bacterium]|nr:BON domain-containing protein [Betaproteobacteria bacterium]